MLTLLHLYRGTDGVSGGDISITGTYHPILLVKKQMGLELLLIVYY